MKSEDSSGVLVGEEFLSLVSHEIKNPLTSISGFANFAEDAVRNNDHALALDSLEVVRNEARRVLKLAEDLLDMSCVRAGKFTLKVQPVDLLGVLKPIVNRYAAMSGRDFHVDAPPVCPRVPGDPERLAQVIENVISNAVKYSEDGTPIRVIMSSNCATLMLTIWNRGPTIPAEKLAFLFKRFSRLRIDADGNGRRKGTGLGLYIARKIVQAHGGTIGARSTDGEGTRFTIELPVDPTWDSR